MASSLIPPRHRSIVARLTAVLALAGCIVALLVIVSSFRSDEDSDGSGPDKQAQTTQQNGGKDPKPDIPKTYTVHEGDNLNSISQQFGVPVGKIERLNPKIDTQILNAGQQLFLR